MSDDVTVLDAQPVCGLTGDDYAQVLADLLPRGLAWPRDPDSIIMTVMRGLAEEFARVTARDCELLAESYPCGAIEALTDWERVCGLPNACTGPLDTVQQRQMAVCGVLAARGGQSLQYYIDLAAEHGFEITIEEHESFRVDLNRAEDPLNDAVWDYVWTVTGITETYIYFSADLSFAEEPLVTWGNRQLECLIREYAPAHTLPMFEYRDPTAVWDAGASIWDTDTVVAIWDGLGVP